MRALRAQLYTLAMRLHALGARRVCMLAMRLHAGPPQEPPEEERPAASPELVALLLGAPGLVWAWVRVCDAGCVRDESAARCCVRSPIERQSSRAPSSAHPCLLHVPQATCTPRCVLAFYLEQKLNWYTS